MFRFDPLFPSSISTSASACRPALHPHQYAECETLLASVSHHSRGVGILRGKHFGHKLVDAPLSEVLKQAGLKIKDVDHLLEVASDLVGHLMCAFVGQLDDAYHVDFDADSSAKETVVEILQCQLDKFNQLGEPKQPKRRGD
jgi:hypothetical protein